MESDESDSAGDDDPSKSYRGQGVKSSMKPDEGSQSSDTDTKTISKDMSLLISEIVDSGQTEFDERHRATVSGEKGILQSNLSSDPNTTTNFGEDKVITRFAGSLAAGKTKID